MEKEVKTYGDLVKYIEEYNLEDKPIILGVEGYNTYCYETNEGYYKKQDKIIRLQELNGFIVLSDDCGIYEEQFYRQELLEEEKE